MLPQEIFLSHSDHDRQFAQDLVAVLRCHGLPVWYSRTNIRGAQQWHDEIGAALHRCDWFVLVLSPIDKERDLLRRALKDAWGLRDNVDYAIVLAKLLEAYTAEH